MAKKDVCLAVYRGQPVTRFVHPEDTHIVMSPGERGEGSEVLASGLVVGKDWFDCTWTIPEVMGPWAGGTIAPNGCPCHDIADAVQFVPTPEQVREFDWQNWAQEALQGFDPNEQILFIRSMTGFFERMHCLIGFEDALCAFYEDPDSVHALFAAILDYKKTVVDCICQVCHPDIFCFDDDYGTANSTFLAPDMWREFFPQYWKPLIDHVHEKGCLFELHSCGYITPLVRDFAQLGMDSLQPVQTHNDLKQLKADAGTMTLRFAIFDKQMQGMFQKEEDVEQALREWYAVLAEGGHFIPDLVPIDDDFYRIQQKFTEKFEQEFFASN